MKKLVQVFLIIIITASSVYAQPGPGGRRPMERIHAAKMAYITDRLRLSSEQSGNFIPLYNDYEKELKELRQSVFKKYKDIDPGEAESSVSLQYIDDDLDYQQRVIELKRKYNERFLKVISPQQLADLHKAEREFKQMLMQKLRQHKQ